MALRTEIPQSSFRPRSSSSTRPTSSQLPINGTPNRTPSSSENPITSSDNGGFEPREKSTSPTASTTPNTPSNAPAFGTVSRCDPIRILGAAGEVPAKNPRKFPTASTDTVMPRAFIHEETSRWQSRIGGERKVRRVPPASSENIASFSQRTITSSASLAKSLLVNTDFTFAHRKKLLPIQDSRINFAAIHPATMSPSMISHPYRFP